MTNSYSSGASSSQDASQDLVIKGIISDFYLQDNKGLIEEIFNNPSFQSLYNHDDGDHAIQSLFDSRNSLSTVKEIVESPAFSSLVNHSPYSVSQLFGHDKDLNTVKAILTNTAIEKLAIDNPSSISRAFDYPNDINIVKDIVETTAFSSLVNHSSYSVSQLFGHDKDLNTVKAILTNTAIEKLAIDNPSSISRAFDYPNDINIVKDIVETTAFSSLVNHSSYSVSQLFGHDKDLNTVKAILTNTAFEKVANDNPSSISRAFNYPNDINIVKDIVESTAFSSLANNSSYSVSELFNHDKDLNAVKAILTNTAIEKLAIDNPSSISRLFDYSIDINFVKDIVETTAFSSLANDSSFRVSELFDSSSDLDAIKSILTNTAIEKLAIDNPSSISRAFDYPNDINIVKDIVETTAFSSLVNHSSYSVSQLFGHDKDLNTVKAILTNTAFEKVANDNPSSISRAFNYPNDINIVKDIVETTAFSSLANNSSFSVSELFDSSSDLDAIKSILTNTAFEKLANDNPSSVSSAFDDSNRIFTLNEIFRSTEFADLSKDPSFSISQLLDSSGDLEQNWKMMVKSQLVTEVSNAEINLDQRHTDVSGGDVLRLGYTLKGNDDTGNPGGDASTLGVNDAGLTNVAVLGPNTKSSNSYTLEISGESLKAGWNLESTDIVLKYNTDIFGEIKASDITIAGELPVNNAISVDDEKGLIRFAAASLSNLGEGSSILGENILASINLDFEDSYFQDTARNPDANGKFTFDGNPLGFELSANSDETVFSRTFSSDIDGKEIGGRKSFLVENSQFTGSDIEVISSTKYWAGQQDILHFNTTLDNPNGVKSVVISEQINNEWVDIVSKTANEIYGENNTLPGSISWAYRSLEDSIGRSSIFGDNALRIQSIYEDAQGTTHATNSYFDKTANPDWAVNQTYGVDGSDSFVFDIDTYTNREIKSLGDLNGNTTFDESKVNLYQAEIKFNEQDDGLTFGTKRVIGANQGFTNLIRTGDTVTAQTSIENIGNSLAQNVAISDAGKVSNAQFLTSRFLDSTTDSGSVNLSGGVFNNDFSYDDTKQESVNIAVDMKVTGAAGSVIDVTQGLFQVTADGMNQNPETADTPKIFFSESGSKNLITFQGDLNYDGRVSMKDLAFLNAGAARQVENTDGTAVAASVARDVDADFSGKIDIADLSILDNDWGKSLHTGTEDFTGSSDTLNWTSLAKQDGATWDNSSFTAQNAIEAQDSYIGSLDAPASTTIGAVTSSTSQDPVSGEETDQGTTGFG